MCRGVPQHRNPWQRLKKSIHNLKNNIQYKNNKQVHTLNLKSIRQKQNQSLLLRAATASYRSIEGAACDCGETWMIVESHSQTVKYWHFEWASAALFKHYGYILNCYMAYRCLTACWGGAIGKYINHGWFVGAAILVYFWPFILLN